ncbi:hypothetical protein [Halomonas piscis]|uniref:hypothetical protein n=1 Tax=Halomonas piscis TaxID=3031727 RepID=UPI0028A090C2|nr:hypothetical protein [Halomonas piscis]
MTPTHTHRERGGRYALVAKHAGGGALTGQHLVIYHDLEKDVQSATTNDDWRQHWRAIAPDDCTVCQGSGTDQIKSNKTNPCGGCYGLGKVRTNGERPTDLWQLADVAAGIIAKRTAERDHAQRQIADPEIQAFVQNLRQQRIDDSIGRQEQEWRAGRGFGPGGQRHTGD